MAFDITGADITLNDTQALADWNGLITAFLAHGAATPQHLTALLDRAPDTVMGHVAKGMFMLLLGRKELNPIGAEALQTANALASDIRLSAREMGHLAALKACVAGRPTEGIAHLEAVLRHCPQDALAMKLSHALRFVMGDSAGMRASLEAVQGAYGRDHMAHGYFKGCMAFALEETGDYAGAEAMGRAGLEHSGDDAWGLHAVAHVHDMRGAARDGLDWLSGREAAWAHCNNFRYHVWWHKALMHLDLGQTDAVLALYDAEIRADKTDDYRDISNATSLLSRLELGGVCVGSRWEELADISANRTEDGCLIFADLHYLLALVGGKRAEATTALMGRLTRDAQSAKTEAQARMAVPGLAAATGLEAFGEGDYASAFLNLSTARPHMIGAGGSHAQRDVFERLTIDAGLRAGLMDDAEALLNDRQSKRGGFEDGYTAARRDMIAEARKAACDATVAAE